MQCKLCSSLSTGNIDKPAAVDSKPFGLIQRLTQSLERHVDFHMTQLHESMIFIYVKLIKFITRLGIYIFNIINLQKPVSCYFSMI